MKNVWPLQDQVFWYLKNDQTPPCNKDRHADVAIIGGGMAGLAAAQAFHTRGKKVVLLEQYYCGSGASGKSSGFITPNAELSLTDFIKRYNLDGAHQIWEFITSGVEDIKENIERYNFSCDYAQQDTLVVANSEKALKDLEVENENLAKLGYKTAYYTADSVKQYIGSTKYFGGVSYENTFGINAYLYCQEMKKKLLELGVEIFEETPVTAIENNVLKTAHAQITADHIIVCGDRFIPELGLLTQDIYHAQTFLLISEQLTDEQMRAIFPEKKLMVWDTDSIYSYFRITGTKRLLLGGGSFSTIYSSKAQHDYTPMIRKLTSYFFEKFPDVTIQFEHVWPGLIGISKDIAPIAGPDKERPFIYYASAASGLPIAAALGRYSAEHIIDGRRDLDAYFSPYRSFPIGGIAQSILGTKLSFALSYMIKKTFS